MNEKLNFDPSMTLGEALQKMRSSASESNLATIISMDIAQALEQHDAVHIVFNCGTSIQDEIAVHLWMMLATTANLGGMHRAVASQEHRNVLSGIGHLKLIGIWLTSLPRITGIILRSLRLKKRLAMTELNQLKEESILEIRQAHGIIL
jgi:ubiquinone biosynthesis protein Coq4